jgi:lysophospholipase L1-like esterase
MPATPLSGEPPSPSACAWRVVGGLLRQALAVSVVLGVLATATELALRSAGVKPQRARESSNVVADGWTGFRLRPGVTGEEAFVTNELGMHAPRSYPPAPPPGVLRVAVLGSSVVYGLNLPFADTLPSALERALQESGREAEVLNFGTHAFSIVNVSALLQAYVHQLQPDVVVVVVDLQVARARWPPLRPGEASTGESIATLGGWRALLARGASGSALAGLLDDPRPARRWLRRTTGLPLHPYPGLEPLGRAARSSAARPDPAPTPAAGGLAAAPPEGIHEYERRRDRELTAPLAAMAAFAAASSIELYLVTPYGPYFRLTGDELGRMSVHHFIEDAVRVHGDARAALAAEVALITRVVRRVADASPARVIDMLEACRGASLRGSGHFSEDGVHLTPEGNAALARVISEHVARGLEADAERGG